MKVGDKVTWYSSGTEKSGVVIANIPAGTNVKKHIPAGAKKSHLKISKDISTVDRMLVEVKAGMYGQIAHYYAARKSLLVVEKED